MINIINENFNPEPETLPHFAWSTVAKPEAVKLTAWSVNNRLEVVNIVCEVRQ